MTPDERRDEAASKYGEFSRHHTDVPYLRSYSAYKAGWNQCRDAEVQPLQKRVEELRKSLADITAYSCTCKYWGMDPCPQCIAGEALDNDDKARAALAEKGNE